MSQFRDARILLMCKAPVPGEVKTRLIPQLGEEGACRLHERLANRIVKEVLDANLCPLQIWCSPSINHAFFQQYVDRAELYEQQGGDIGERMHQSAVAALEQTGVNRVLIVGTDTPEVDAAYLSAALEALENHDAVIGPAEDGGYVLIGLRKAVPAVFEHVSWSTGTVYSESCRNLNNLKWNWVALPRLWDVDEPADLKRLPESLR